MRRFLLYLNGVAVADYFTRGRAESAFSRKMHSIRKGDLLELIDVCSGHRIAANF